VGNGPADQAILDGDGQGVTDVETAGDVGRGTGDDEGVVVGPVGVGGLDVFWLEEALG
jgi:hypothetical protein